MKWKAFIPAAQEIVRAYRANAPEGFDPKSCAITVGVVAAGALAAGATAYSATSASSSASAANSQNARNVSDTNQLNWQEFQQSRGANGSAIYPIYAQPAEQALYNDTMNVYDATGAVSPTAADYQRIIAGVQPMANQANAVAAGIFNGNTQGQELANEQPVAQANLDLATSQKSATLEALQQTLNNIKSIQAGKGYAGDSFGNQLLNFQARQGANTTGAQLIGQANLTNAQAVQAIKQNALNRQIANISLPGQIAQQNINLAQAPANALNNQMVNRQNLFGNFKIGTNSFQYQNLPLVSPTASTGQIVGQGIGSLAGGVGNLLAYNGLGQNGYGASLSAADLTPVTRASNGAILTQSDLTPVSAPAGENIAALNGSGLN